MTQYFELDTEHGVFLDVAHQTDDRTDGNAVYTHVGA